MMRRRYSNNDARESLDDDGGGRNVVVLLRALICGLLFYPSNKSTPTPLNAVMAHAGNWLLSLLYRVPK